MILTPEQINHYKARISLRFSISKEATAEIIASHEELRAEVMTAEEKAVLDAAREWYRDSGLDAESVFRVSDDLVIACRALDREDARRVKG